MEALPTVLDAWHGQSETVMLVALSAQSRYRVLHDPHESGAVTQQMNAAGIVGRETLRRAVEFANMPAG